jgi:hypothetical protein
MTDKLRVLVDSKVEKCTEWCFLCRSPQMNLKRKGVKREYFKVGDPLRYCNQCYQVESVHICKSMFSRFLWCSIDICKTGLIEVLSHKSSLLSFMYLHYTLQGTKDIENPTQSKSTKAKEKSNTQSSLIENNKQNSRLNISNIHNWAS